MELVKVKASDYGLEENKAVKISESFAPKVIESEGYTKVYENILTKEVSAETCKEARELRLKLVKTRTGIASVHKVEKAFYLAAGKYCDALKNKLTLPVSQMEEKLEEIENHYENIEKEKTAKLQEERKTELSKYLDDNSILPENLGEMQEEIWNNFLVGTKTNFEAKKADEKKAEEERLEKEKIDQLHNERKEIISPYWNFIPLNKQHDNFGTLTELEWKDRFDWTVNEKVKHDKKQAEISAENERLKKEAEQKAAKDKKEREAREKADAERKAKEEKEQKAREEKASQEKAKHEAELRKEREAREKAEIAAQKEKEHALEQERIKSENEEKERQAELNKGDSDKVNDLINDLDSIKEKYVFSSDINKQKFIDTCVLIDKVIDHINK